MIARLRKHSEDTEPRSIFQIHPISPTSFLATTSDNVLRLWSLPTLTSTKQTSFVDYIYAINYDPLTSVIYLGDGSGNLLTLTLSLEETRRQKVHGDLLTQVVLTAEGIVTASADGRVKVLERETWEERRVFELGEPVWRVREVGGVLYVGREGREGVRIVGGEVVGLGRRVRDVVEVKGGEGEGEGGRVLASDPGMKSVWDLGTGEVVHEGECHGMACYKGGLVVLNNKRVTWISKQGSKREWRFPCHDNPSILDVKVVGEYLVVGLDNAKVMALCLNEE